MNTTTTSNFLSFTSKPFTTISPITHFPSKPTHHHHQLHHTQYLLKSTSDNTNNNINSITTNKNNNEVDASSSQLPDQAASPAAIRFKRISRRKARQQEQEMKQQASSLAPNKPPKVQKEWESMSLSEKALELYVGEKGLLFWINKFAYASIYIIIGAWILFRFVGPALNLYQLDAPPLSPSAVLKGST